MVLEGNKKEVGNDATIFIGSEEFAVTSASYSEEADISEVQFNTSLTNSIAVTGVSYSGSFEHNGSNKQLRDALYTEQSAPTSAIPAEVSLIVIKDSEHVYKFRNCLVSSRSKDLPSDDRTSVTYDFVCEEVVVTAA